MEATNEESPEPDTQSFQSRTEKTTEDNFSQRTAGVNGDAILGRVLDSLEREQRVIPLCWPDSKGQCACPKKHTNPKEIGKAPLLGKGYQERILTRGEVEDWWRRYPQANYGILLKPSGLFVLDADSLEADREIEFLGVSPGPRVRRGDHIHRYFKNDTGLCGVAIRQGRSGEVDILSNGYVVGPGSLHQSGIRYTEEVTFGELELDSPPRWAVDLLREAGSGKDETEEIPQELPEVSIDNLPVSRFTKALIRTGPAADPQRYPSRSEAVFAVLTSLLHAGVTDTVTLASILLNPRHTISEKPREQGQRWLAGEIAHAKAKYSADRAGDGKANEI